MQIAGAGITPFTCKVKVGYKPLTTLAIKWVRLSSGNWAAVDRGATNDTYEAEFNIYGLESTINTFITEIEANRTAADFALSLTDFQATEHIFGENVDHSGTITATLLSHSRRTQGSWKGFGLQAVVRATTFSLTGSSSFPTLQYCDVGADADTDVDVNKIDGFTGSFTYLDHKNEAGIFEGVFTLSDANHILLRNYIQNQRTGNFTLADTFGVSYPFGPRSANSYPFTCKLIEWEDMGWWGLKWHRIRLKFAEAV